MHEYSDEQLLQLLQNSDERAFYALYDKHHHAVYLNIQRTLHNQAEVEDILQDVFFRLWQKRHSLSTDRPISGWLFIVSYHLMIDHVRGKQKQKKALEQYLPQEENESSIEEAEIQYSLMEEAIHKLSPQKRKVFELCKLQGKSYENAASELGISRNTVSDYLKEAMASIRLHVRHSPYASMMILTAMKEIFS